MEQKRMQETAILVVSFGSTHLDTLEGCIAATERTIGKALSDYQLYRAFLSPTVMRSLKKKYDIHVNTVEEALQQIKEDGYKRVVVQPTLLLKAIEYELLVKELQKETRLWISIGRPLLETKEDCEVLASILIEENPLKTNETLMLMGHGTEHEANEVYSVLQQVFEEREYSCLIGTVEGIPSLEDAVNLLVESGASSARLLPLMFVAGEHAKNDMAGEEDSFLSMILEKGIAAHPIFKGLGESEKVQNLYVKRAFAALEKVEV